MRSPSPAAPGLASLLSPCSAQLRALLCHLFNLPLPFPEESFLGTDSFLHSALYFPPKSTLATFTVTNHQLPVSDLHSTAHLYSCLQPSAAFSNLPQPISFITMEFLKAIYTSPTAITKSTRTSSHSHPEGTGAGS